MAQSLPSSAPSSRVPTPSSPSSTSGESISEGEAAAGGNGAQTTAGAGNSSTVAGDGRTAGSSSRQTQGSPSHVRSDASTSSSTLSNPTTPLSAATSEASTGHGNSRRRHQHHTLATLGTGSAKMGNSITDSAPSTEDEKDTEEEADDTDADDSRPPRVYYPALATPTATNASSWPFGVFKQDDPKSSDNEDDMAVDQEHAHTATRIDEEEEEDGDGVSMAPTPSSPGSASRHQTSFSAYAQYFALQTEQTRSPAHLPHEILLKILKNVRATPDLVSSLQVCKSWCQCGVELLWNKPLFPHVGPLIKMLVVLTRPIGSTTFAYASFIKRLNFSQLADRMSDSLLEKLKVCENLERLTLAGCVELTDWSLGRLLPHFKKLVALDLSDCDKITDVTVQAAAESCRRLQGLNLSGCKLITDEGIEAVAKGCLMLRRVKLRNLETLTDRAVVALALHCPLLLEADLHSCSSITDRSLHALFRNSSHLRELSLNNCTSVTGAAFPQKDVNKAVSGPGGHHGIFIAGGNDRSLIGKNLNVKILAAAGVPASPKIRASRGLTAAHDDDSAARYFPQFSDPSAGPLANCTILSPRMFEHVRYLDLTGLSHLTDAAMDGIVSTMPHIRNLVLAKCVNLTDDTVYSICKLGKHIHFLHLGHVSNITDKAVTQLARSCTRLRYIDLACCPQLRDLSVFELAHNLPRLKRIGLVRVSNLTDQAIHALSERSTLERIHLSYCEQISVSAIHYLLQRLHRLNHLSLTGVPAFRRPDLQHFCRPPPKDFNPHQRSTFCVYSGKGVLEVRSHLEALEREERGGNLQAGLLLRGVGTGGNPQHQQQMMLPHFGHPHQQLLPPNPPTNGTDDGDATYEEIDVDEDDDEEGEAGGDSDDEGTMRAASTRTTRPGQSSNGNSSARHRHHHTQRTHHQLQPAQSGSNSNVQAGPSSFSSPSGTTSRAGARDQQTWDTFAGRQSHLSPSSAAFPSRQPPSGPLPSLRPSSSDRSTTTETRDALQSAFGLRRDGAPSDPSDFFARTHQQSPQMPAAGTRTGSRGSASSTLQMTPQPGQQVGPSSTQDRFRPQRREGGQTRTPQQPGRQSYLDTMPSPIDGQADNVAGGSSHVGPSDYLRLDRLANILSPSVQRAAREQDLYEGGHVDGGMDVPGQQERRMSVEPDMASAAEDRFIPIEDSARQRGGGRERRDTIMQSNWRNDGGDGVAEGQSGEGGDSRMS